MFAQWLPAVLLTPQIVRKTNIRICECEDEFERDIPHGEEFSFSLLVRSDARVERFRFQSADMLVTAQVVEEVFGTQKSG